MSQSSPPPTKPKAQFTWDIDRHLNRFIPYPRLHLLPRPIAHFLGHRSTPPKPVSQPWVWFWSFLGAFLGLIFASLFFRIPYLKHLSGQTFASSTTEGHLIILGSLGASAILEYNTITSPLAQPRNAILGQGMSAAIGIAFLRIFQSAIGDKAQVDNLRFVAGALAVGVASAVMGMTKTVYPPAGATCLLAATSQQVSDLGWILVPVAMGASAIMVVTALLINNIQRQFPIWWWTELPLTPPSKQQDEEKGDDEVTLRKTQSMDSEWTEKASVQHHEHVKKDTIAITSGEIHVPSYIQLSAEEFAFLEVLKMKFEGAEVGERTSHDTFVNSA